MSAINDTSIVPNHEKTIKRDWKKHAFGLLKSPGRDSKKFKAMETFFSQISAKYITYITYILYFQGFT